MYRISLQRRGDVDDCGIVFVLIKQQSDAGRYVCKAKNAAARASKELLLQVQGQFTQ